MRKHYPTDISDARWNYMKPHLPAPKGLGRPRTHPSVLPIAFLGVGTPRVGGGRSGSEAGGL